MKNNKLNLIEMNSLILKIVSIICFSFISIYSNAQEDKMNFNAETKQVISDNISQGKPVFEGLTSKLTISYQANKLIDSQRTSIINEIKNTNGVKDCYILENAFEVIVISEAQKECPQYAVFKEIISNNGLIVIENKEIIYK